MKHRCVRLECATGVHHDLERLVVDHHELRRITGELSCLGDDGGDRLADVPRLADRKRVVLDLAARVGGDLEERVGEERDLVAGERPVHAGKLERGAHIDRGDLRVRVRRAHEVQVAHPVPLDVVEEETLALNEPVVLLAGDAQPDRAPLESGHVGLGRGHAAPPLPASTTASTMFQ